MSYVVLEHPQLDDARVLVHIDAVPENLARGWLLVGPCSERYRDPLLSDDEQLLADHARAALEADVAAAAAAAAEAAQTPDAAGVAELVPDGENADGPTPDQE